MFSSIVYYKDIGKTTNGTKNVSVTNVVYMYLQDHLDTI